MANSTIYKPLTIEQMNDFVDICTAAGFKYLPSEDFYGVRGEYTQHYIKNKISLRVTLEDMFWTVSFD